jgi:hypothetical protein
MKRPLSNDISFPITGAGQLYSWLVVTITPNGTTCTITGRTLLWKGRTRSGQIDISMHRGGRVRSQFGHKAIYADERYGIGWMSMGIIVGIASSGWPGWPSCRAQPHNATDITYHNWLIPTTIISKKYFSFYYILIHPHLLLKLTLLITSTLPSQWIPKPHMNTVQAS